MTVLSAKAGAAAKRASAMAVAVMCFIFVPSVILEWW
jgi:hypothetical protein